MVSWAAVCSPTSRRYTNEHDVPISFSNTTPRFERQAVAVYRHKKTGPGILRGR